MAYLFITNSGTGFEDAVRYKLGVTNSELINPEISNPYIGEYGEKIILNRVTDYSLITDETDKMLLESAIISYICFLICPSLNRKLNNEVLTIDVTWKKSKVDWLKMADYFYQETEQILSKISSVTVTGASDYPVGGIANFGGA